MRRVAIVIVLTCCAAIAGCSHASAPQLLPAAGGSGATLTLNRGIARPDSTAFRAIYSFGKAPYDSEQPTAALIPYNGTLYGTAHEGGAYGKGTVFSVTPTGTEKKFHSFRDKDGTVPYSELLDLNGVFYGTTYSGGANTYGTIYSITSNGSYKVLRSFQGGQRDGQGPVGGLVALNGTLYGTTSGGGSAGDGIAFSITPKGTEQVIHSFAGSDGAAPYATLTVVNGALYGSTLRGGAYQGGTVFSMSTSGNEKVLRSFGRRTDGASLTGRLLDVNGTLYGTTVLGGAGNFGTVFKLSLTGKETVLYSFDGAANGCHPYSGLVNVKGVLYGSTYGEFSKSSCTSLGTIYRITRAGDETTLHAFGGKSGANPYANLVLLGSKLYGTTWYGGAYKIGVVYSLSL